MGQIAELELKVAALSERVAKLEADAETREAIDSLKLVDKPQPPQANSTPVVGGFEAPTEQGDAENAGSGAAESLPETPSDNADNRG